MKKSLFDIEDPPEEAPIETATPEPQTKAEKYCKTKPDSKPVLRQKSIFDVEVNSEPQRTSSKEVLVTADGDSLKELELELKEEENVESGDLCQDLTLTSSDESDQEDDKIEAPQKQQNTPPKNASPKPIS